jgi:hypothetical protein
MEEIVIFITFDILRWEGIRDLQYKVSNFCGLFGIFELGDIHAFPCPLQKGLVVDGTTKLQGYDLLMFKSKMGKI